MLLTITQPLPLNLQVLEPREYVELFAGFDGKSKPDDIAEAQSHLGEKTDDYATNAPRGYKTKLHTLGKALSSASKSLA